MGNICRDLKAIPTFQIPQHLGLNSTEHQPIEYNLICFSDASGKAYATAVYLHQLSPDSCSVDLVFSKTRLAPQEITIPRLELLGVLIGTRALRFVEKELHLPISSKVLWTDSQCVLQWLHSKKPLSTFVTNRLKEIKSLEGASFKYIPTQENPADLATRGKSPSELLQSIWWNGPTWLARPLNQWPEYSIPEVDLQSEMKSEVKKEIVFEAKLIVGDSTADSSLTPIDLSDIDIERFSTLKKLLRTTAWILRYADRLLKKPTNKEALTATEIQKAKKSWDLFIQQKCFSDTIRVIKRGETCNN